MFIALTSSYRLKDEVIEERLDEQGDHSIKDTTNESKQLEWWQGTDTVTRHECTEFFTWNSGHSIPLTRQWWDVLVKSVWFCFCLLSILMRMGVLTIQTQRNILLELYNIVDLKAQCTILFLPIISVSFEEVSRRFPQPLSHTLSRLGSAVAYVCGHQGEPMGKVLWDGLSFFCGGLKQGPRYQSRECDSGNRDSGRQTDRKQDRQLLRVTRERQKIRGQEKEKERNEKPVRQTDRARHKETSLGTDSRKGHPCHFILRWDILRFFKNLLKRGMIYI